MTLKREASFASRRGAAQFAKIAAGEKRRNWTLIAPLSLSHKLSGSRKSEVDATHKVPGGK